MKKKTGGLIFISLIFSVLQILLLMRLQNDADKAIEKKKAAIMKIMSQKQFKPHKLKEYGYAAEFCIGF